VHPGVVLGVVSGVVVSGVVASEQDTTILELDDSNDLSQYFTNSDDFILLESDDYDMVDCGGKATTCRIGTTWLCEWWFSKFGTGHELVLFLT
jgi:hypothetical protein